MIPDRTFVSPRPLSRSCSHRHTSTLATTICADLTATANSMEQALQEWCYSYQIQEEAYTQLQSLLQSFGIPIESMHSADGGHGSRILPESSMVDPSLFRAGPPDSGTTNNSYSNKALSAQVELGTSTLRGSPTEGILASPFESAITTQGYPHQGPSVLLPNLGITNDGLSDKRHGVGLFDMSTSSEGSSNQSPTIWQNSNTSVYTGGLDFIAFTNNMPPTESFQQVNSITSDRISNTAAEDLQIVALPDSQSIPESPSRPRPCIRCWKRKLRVHPVSLFDWTLVDQ